MHILMSRHSWLNFYSFINQSICRVCTVSVMICWSPIDILDVFYLVDC